MEIENVVREVLKAWNQNCKVNNINRTYIVDIKIRNKRYYTTKTKFYELNIGELIFRCEGDKSLLLYRYELEIPKLKNTTKNEVEINVKKSLIQYFLYEAIGIFALQSESLIGSQELSEYDAEKDRLSQNPEYKDCVIEVTEDAEWFKKGDTFDVCTKQGSMWGVYSALPEFKKNNYVGAIHNKYVKVIVNPKVKIELLDEVITNKKRKIILNK